MVEAQGAGSGQLNELLAQERDWARAAIFTDTKQVIASRDCNLLPDEIE